MTSMRRELEDAAPPGAAPPRAVPPREAVVAALVRHLHDTLAPFRESA
jgi:hypothetical protein